MLASSCLQADRGFSWRETSPVVRAQLESVRDAYADTANASCNRTKQEFTPRALPPAVAGRSLIWSASGEEMS